MTEEELYNEYRSCNCKSFTDFLINKIAELKKKNLDTQDAVTMQMYTNRANKEIADKQLTKAKEIIKELNEGLDKLYLSGLSDKQIAFIEQLQDKTEQFLKESE